MAFHDLEKKKLERVLAAYVEKRRPPAHIRPQLDLDFKVHGQSVELVEIRPQWNDPSKIHEYPIAKATYVKTQKVWRVFWQRADLRWHGYEPAATVRSVEEFLAVVDADQYGCFFG